MDRPLPADRERAPRGVRIVRASELAEHAYCRRAWWLRRVRGRPAAGAAARARGQRAHERHAHAARRADRARALGLCLLAAGLGLLLLWALP